MNTIEYTSSIKQARHILFIRHGDGWMASLDGGDTWIYVDQIEMEHVRKVTLPSLVMGDEEGFAELEPDVVCEFREVEDTSYPGGNKKILVCRKNR